MINEDDYDLHDSYLYDLHHSGNENEFVNMNRATNLRWQAYV
jgi:hypothetical protein